MPLLYSSSAVLAVAPELSPGISLPTYHATYAPFTPSHSGQRLLPTYYRGCWHVVSRSLLLGYRHFLRPPSQNFTIRRPSSFTRYCWFRVPSIDQYSPLLPPVGVWAVLNPNVADHPLRSATHCCLGRPLPHQLANRTRAHLQPINLSPLSDAALWSYPVLAAISSRYPSVEGRLLTRYSPVRR